MERYTTSELRMIADILEGNGEQYHVKPNGRKKEAKLGWDAFVDHMCKTNEFYPDDPNELTDDDYEDLKEEYKWYSREH